MRQLAGTRTRHRRAYAAPLAGLISDRVECSTHFAAGSEAFVSAVSPVDSVAGADVIDSGTAVGFVATGGVTSTVLEHPNEMQERNRRHINDCRTRNSIVWFLMCRGRERIITSAWGSTKPIDVA